MSTSRSYPVSHTPGRSVFRLMASSRGFVLASVVVGIAFALLYTWRLDQIPPYLNQDEAGFGLTSYLLLTTGRDYFGNLLPPYVGYFDNHQLGGAMLAYWGVPFVQAGGLSAVTLRFSMAVLAGISLVLFGYLVWRVTSDRVVSLAGVLLLGTTPLFFIQSRLFLEMALPVPFVICWLICLVEFDLRRDERFFVLASAILGIGFYSYGTARMVMPLYCGVMLVVYRFAGTCSWRTVAWSAAVFAMLLVPTAVFAARNPDLYQARFQSLTWLHDSMPFSTIVETFARQFLGNLDLRDLFVSGDTSLVHSTGKAGVFLLGTMVPAVAGCGALLHRAVRHRSAFSFVVLLAVVLYPAPLALLDELHAPSRGTYILPVYVLVCVIGLVNLMPSIWKRGIGRALLIALAALIVCQSVLFFTDYFQEYPARAAATEYFNGNKPEAFRMLMEGVTESQVFYDTEDDTSSTYARFFKAELGYGGALLPAPPEWADKIPPGARLLTSRPDRYGGAFERVAEAPDLRAAGHYVVLVKIGPAR